MCALPKYSNEALIHAALTIIREHGTDALTARSLGRQLHSAPSTIFSHYPSMQAVFTETVKTAREIFGSYAQRGLQMASPFKGLALEYVRFAAEDPNVFSLVFFNPVGTAGTLKDILGAEDQESRLLQSVSDTFRLDREQAGRFFHELWIYIHGIAALTAVGVFAFSQEELGRMLDNACQSFLTAL